MKQFYTPKKLLYPPPKKNKFLATPLSDRYSSIAISLQIEIKQRRRITVSEHRKPAAEILNFQQVSEVGT